MCHRPWVGRGSRQRVSTLNALIEPSAESMHNHVYGMESAECLAAVQILLFCKNRSLLPVIRVPEPQSQWYRDILPQGDTSNRLGTADKPNGLGSGATRPGVYGVITVAAMSRAIAVYVRPEPYQRLQADLVRARRT